jgi:alkylation response protein AidB-like acyl-CoA dehydrogenase
MEEMGRVLLCAPFLGTVVLAATTLIESGDEGAQAAYLPAIAGGELIATLALAEDTGGWDPSALSTVATRRDGQWSLSGSKSFVLDATTAELVLVAAQAPAGISIFAVDATTTGLTRSPLSTMDLTRKLGRIGLDNTPATLIGVEGDGSSVLGRVLQLAAVALAAEQLGGAQRCLEMSVEYAKQRIQFGRPIGSFQAVKHRCAEMLVQIEMAKSAAYYASDCAAAADPDLPVAAAMAKSYCSEAFFRVAADTIQTHGGIGFTWEHPAHLYFKRAASSQLLFGNPVAHRRRLAGALGVGAGS